MTELYDVFIIWQPSENESPRTGPFKLTEAKALASELNRRLKLNPARKGRAKVMVHVSTESMLGWAGPPTPTSKPCPGYDPDSVQPRPTHLGLSKFEQDNRTDMPCPKCRGMVLYNGGYYCSSCKWVAPHTWSTRKGGKLVPFLAGLIRVRRSQGQDTSTEEFYLPDGHPDKLTPGRRGSTELVE